APRAARPARANHSNSWERAIRSPRSCAISATFPGALILTLRTRSAGSVPAGEGPGRRGADRLARDRDHVPARAERAQALAVRVPGSGVAGEPVQRMPGVQDLPGAVLAALCRELRRLRAALRLGL